MDREAAAILLGFAGSFMLMAIAICVFFIIVNWKMYEKAGKPGWASIVPIYNMVVLFEIIGFKWYYIFFLLLGFVPVVGIFLLLAFTLIYNVKLAKSFGQTVGFGIGLWFLSPVFTAIIAFSSDIKYVGPSVKGDLDFKDLF